MQVDFYHLTATPLARALPAIAEKVLASGERLLIVSADKSQCRELDRVLWTYAPDSFLPHAQLGAGPDGDQPVLIAPEITPANHARFVALVDGQWRDDALGFRRAFHFFEGEHIASARAAWRSLADREGIERRYWKQNDAGRWTQAA